MPPSPLARLRKLCLALPEAREVVAWGEPTWRVKTMFAMYANPHAHHGAGRPSVWVKTDHTNQGLLVAVAPDRFYVPPYAGAAGWVGVYLDGPSTDWDELSDLLWDAWLVSAPPRLAAQHLETASAPGRPTPKTRRRPTSRRATLKTERGRRRRQDVTGGRDPRSA